MTMGSTLERNEAGATSKAARRTVERVMEIVAIDGTIHEAFRSILSTTHLRREVLDAAIDLCDESPEWDGPEFERTRNLLVLANRSLPLAA
jgi:hypothetical protein